MKYILKKLLLPIIFLFLTSDSPKRASFVSVYESRYEKDNIINEIKPLYNKGFYIFMFVFNFFNKLFY